MKQITIKNFHSYEVQKHREGDGKDILVWGLNDMEVSDGYHTIDELYEHRISLWISLCKGVFSMSVVASRIAGIDKALAHGAFLPVWRSKNHSDGEPAFGGTWFVLGIGKEKGKQMTYHLPIEKWEECDFAETLDKAPDFDGHTATDVLERIKSL